MDGLRQQRIDAVECWTEAELRAVRYLSELEGLTKGKGYLDRLAGDIRVWRKGHVRPFAGWSLYARFRKEPDTRDIGRYLTWLEQKGRLDSYLDRSVSYIYLRDLGKALDDPAVMVKMRRTVAGVKRELLERAATKHKAEGRAEQASGWPNRLGNERTGGRTDSQTEGLAGQQTSKWAGGRTAGWSDGRTRAFAGGGASGAVLQGAAGFMAGFADLDGLYRWGQKEGVEDAVIWVTGKLAEAAAHIPDSLSPEHAQRKLIKIIVGVVLHVYDELEEGTPEKERAARLDEAIRIGYSYGLTYPFVDDLLDSGVLDNGEKERFSALLRESLLTGEVPAWEEREEWRPDNLPLIRYVYGELREAFEYIRSRQQGERLRSFLEQGYVFYAAQEADRSKTLLKPDYTSEELYVPLMIKSASSRSIVRSVLRSPAMEEVEARLFYYGIYNQLSDDFADLFDDLEAGAVTPYTYYWTHHAARPELTNPFELYWAVIAHLLHGVYRSDGRTREVLLDRTINGLKRCRARLGADRYRKLMDLFAAGMGEFRGVLDRLAQHAVDVDFLDKLLRDRLAGSLRVAREEERVFRETLRTVRKRVDAVLRVEAPDKLGSAASCPKKASEPDSESGCVYGGTSGFTVVEAANYSLEGGGKRLRPILAWFMGVQEYGLPQQAVEPLMRSLEYMHTASLIFDDLPSQDNALLRRGRASLHERYGTATAELAGLFLMQKAVEEQASLQGFRAAAINRMMVYAAQAAQQMCLGQELDLASSGKELGVQELERICYYKTGLAFEACLIMPALLAGAGQEELEALRDYAYHMGIAFQIRDDLLDVEGDEAQTGKTAGLDQANGRSTFVTALGALEARRAMWQHYTASMDALGRIPRRIPFLHQLALHVIRRGQ